LALTRQLTDKPSRGLPTHGLDKSRSGQLTVSQMQPKEQKLEMWANAQRDGRPAEYRWHPLFNATKFGWCPLLKCCAVTLPRCETRWNYLGCPKITRRSQPLVDRSSPYCGDVWRRYCCLTSFFWLSICALFVKI